MKSGWVHLLRRLGVTALLTILGGLAQAAPAAGGGGAAQSPDFAPGANVSGGAIDIFPVGLPEWADHGLNASDGFNTTADGLVDSYLRDLARYPAVSRADSHPLSWASTMRGVGGAVDYLSNWSDFTTFWSAAAHRDGAGLSQELAHSIASDWMIGSSVYLATEVAAILALGPWVTGGVVIAAAVGASVAYAGTGKPAIDYVADGLVEASLLRKQVVDRIALAEVRYKGAQSACFDASARVWELEDRIAALPDPTAITTAARAAAQLAEAQDGRARAACSALEGAPNADTVAAAAEARAAEIVAQSRDAQRYSGDSCRSAGPSSRAGQAEVRSAAQRVDDVAALHGRAHAAVADGRAALAGARARLDAVRSTLAAGEGAIAGLRASANAAIAAGRQCLTLKTAVLASLAGPPYDAAPMTRPVRETVQMLPADQDARAAAFGGTLTTRAAEYARVHGDFDWAVATISDADALMSRCAATAAVASSVAGAQSRVRRAVAAVEQAAAAIDVAMAAGGCGRDPPVTVAGAGTEPAPDDRGGNAAEPPTTAWTASEGATTVSGGQGGGNTGPAISAAAADRAAVTDLLAAARDAYDACAVDRAASLVGQARSLAPQEPYVAQLSGLIETRRQAIAATLSALRMADQAVARGNRDLATAFMQSAQDRAPDCFTQQVAGALGGARDAMAKQREAASQGVRDALGGLVSVIVAGAGAVAAAQGGGGPGGSGPAVAAPGGVMPGMEGIGTATGTAGGLPGVAGNGAAPTGDSCYVETRMAQGADGQSAYLLLEQVTRRPTGAHTNLFVQGVPAADADMQAQRWQSQGWRLDGRYGSAAQAISAANARCPNPARAGG